MNENEVRQVLLDAIAEAASKVGVGTSTGEALRNLAEAWVLLAAESPRAKARTAG